MFRTRRVRADSSASSPGIRRRRRRRARGRRGRTSLRELRERADDHLAPRGGAQLPPRRPGGVAGRARTSARTSRRGRPRGGPRAKGDLEARRGAASSRSAPTSAASAAGIARLGERARGGGEAPRGRRARASASRARERERTLDPAASEGNAHAPAWRSAAAARACAWTAAAAAAARGPRPSRAAPTPRPRARARPRTVTPPRRSARGGGRGARGRPRIAPPPRRRRDDARASAEFSGGPGGDPAAPVSRRRGRVRVGRGPPAGLPPRGGVSARDAEGRHAPRGGFHALCHYLRAYSELEKLWVLEGSESAAAAGARSRGEGSISTRGVVGGVARDAPGDDLGADDSPGEEDPSSRRYPSFGADGRGLDGRGLDGRGLDGRGLDGRGLDGRGSLAASTLANLLGAETAASVDVTALDALLERRGYAPRAGTERPPPGGYDAFDETSRASRWSDDESCAPSSRASSMSTTTTVRGGRDDRSTRRDPGASRRASRTARGAAARPWRWRRPELFCAGGDDRGSGPTARAALIAERREPRGVLEPAGRRGPRRARERLRGAPTRRGSGSAARARGVGGVPEASGVPAGRPGTRGLVRDDDRGDPRGAGGERGPSRERVLAREGSRSRSKASASPFVPEAFVRRGSRIRGGRALAPDGPALGDDSRAVPRARSSRRFRTARWLAGPRRPGRALAGGGEPRASAPRLA